MASRCAAACEHTITPARGVDRHPRPKSDLRGVLDVNGARVVSFANPGSVQIAAAACKMARSRGT